MAGPIVFLVSPSHPLAWLEPHAAGRRAAGLRRELHAARCRRRPCSTSPATTTSACPAILGWSTGAVARGADLGSGCDGLAAGHRDDGAARRAGTRARRVLRVRGRAGVLLRLRRQPRRASRRCRARGRWWSPTPRTTPRSSTPAGSPGRGSRSCRTTMPRRSTRCSPPDARSGRWWSWRASTAWTATPPRCARCTPSAGPAARCSWWTRRTGSGCAARAGAGCWPRWGWPGADDVVATVTLSKALGAQGGAVLGPAAVTAHLVDTARSFIFDTGLAPRRPWAPRSRRCTSCAAEPERPAAVLRHAAALAAAAGVPAPPSAVVPVVLGEPEVAVAAARRCRGAGRPGRVLPAAVGAGGHEPAAPDGPGGPDGGRPRAGARGARGRSWRPWGSR